jgi:carbon monoxide dehydrogenase subunit G
MEIVIPERQFKVITSIGFGTVKVTFDADVEMVELQPPTFAKIKAHGKAPGSGADVVSEMHLSSNPENTLTELKWLADISIVGSIASLASRLLGGMTKKLSGAFFDCVKSKIEALREVKA